MILGRLSVILDARDEKFNAAMASAHTKMTALNAKAMTVSRTMRNLGKSLTGVGLRMTTGFTLPVGLGVAALVRSFGKFEEAMMEVQKVTDEFTAGQLRPEIKAMAEEIPRAREEIAGLAADAARFGIRGVENIKNFTQVVTEMSASSDLATEDAGRSLAKLSGLTNTPISQLRNLSSAIQLVADNARTSESEIVESSLKASASLSRMGMSQVEITALSASLNEVSASSRRAGTRLRRIGQIMMLPRKAEEIGEILGLTAEQFTKMRDNSPIQTMMLLIDTMRKGGQAAGELSDAFGSAGDAALGALSQNPERIIRNLNMMSKGFEEGSYSAKVFSQVIQTPFSRLRMELNKMINSFDSLAEIVTPVIIKLIQWIRRAVEWFGNMRREVQETITWITLMVAVIAPLITILGFVVLGLNAMWTALTSLVLVIIPALPGIITFVATVALLGTALLAATISAHDFTAETERTNKKVEKSTMNIQDWIYMLKLMGVRAKFTGKIIYTAFQGAFDNIRQLLSDVFTFFIRVFDNIKVLAKQSFEYATTPIWKWDEIKNSQSISSLEEITEGLFKSDNYGDVVQDISDLITEMNQELEKVKAPDLPENMNETMNDVKDKVGEKIQEIQNKINELAMPNEMASAMAGTPLPLGPSPKLLEAGAREAYRAEFNIRPKAQQGFGAQDSDSLSNIKQNTGKTNKVLERLKNEISNMRESSENLEDY